MGIVFKNRKLIAYSICIYIIHILVFVQISIAQAEFNKNLTVHYIDVGQADSILVELPNSQTMLIDSGDRDDGPIIAKYLRDNGIHTINYIIATHPHADHIGGFPYIIESFADIKSIYMPKFAHQTQTFERLLTSITNKRLKINTAEAGVNILALPNLQIDIIAPMQKSYTKLNDWSAVIKLRYKNKVFLFMGDAESLSESQIDANIDADILKVGHHGSITSTSDSFLRQVSSEYAIISVGKNTYGHPDDRVLEKLKNDGIHILRTDEHGTIVMTSDGNNVTVNTKKSLYSHDALTPFIATTHSSANTLAQNRLVQTAASLQDANTIVYMTKTGEKYHRDDCRYLKESKYHLIDIPLKDIKKFNLKFTACKVCKPHQ